MSDESTTTTETPEAAAPPAAPETTETPEAAAPPEAAKPADEPAKPAVPEKYEFKWPEGFTPDAEQLAGYEASFRELGLTNEQAQAIVGKYAEQHVAAMKNLDNEVERQTKEWVDTVRADPELGGKNFDATVRAAEQAMGQFGSPELKTWLDTTGLSNHPELVRMFARVGRAIGEDRLAGGRSTVASRQSIEHRMYPNH